MSITVPVLSIPPPFHTTPALNVNPQAAGAARIARDHAVAVLAGRPRSRDSAHGATRAAAAGAARRCAARDGRGVEVEGGSRRVVDASSLGRPCCPGIVTEPGGFMRAGSAQATAEAGAAVAAFDWHEPERELPRRPDARSPIDALLPSGRPCRIRGWRTALHVIEAAPAAGACRCGPRGHGCVTRVPLDSAFASSMAAPSEHRPELSAHTPFPGRA